LDEDVSPAAAGGETGRGPIEGLSLLVLLDHLARRTERIETQLTARETPGGSRWLEVAKAVIGWPLFGLLFLILFYGPLHQAISAIPSKVENADQIEMFGVSLKSTIRTEAKRIGESNLSETLPALSPSAIELLLRASEGPETTIVSYSIEHDLITRVWLPGPQLLDTLQELEQKGLVTTSARASGKPDEQPSQEGIEKIRAGIRQFQGQYRGRETASEPARVQWDLEKPLRFEPPYFAWRLTDLGKKGVDVILRAVSSQLSSTNKS
jgi:hypothetical protein